MTGMVARSEIHNFRSRGWRKFSAKDGDSHWANRTGIYIFCNTSFQMTPSPSSPSCFFSQRMFTLNEIDLMVRLHSRFEVVKVLGALSTDIQIDDADEAYRMVHVLRKKKWIYQLNKSRVMSRKFESQFGLGWVGSLCRTLDRTYMDVFTYLKLSIIDFENLYNTCFGLSLSPSRCIHHLDRRQYLFRHRRIVIAIMLILLPGIIVVVLCHPARLVVVGHPFHTDGMRVIEREWVDQ